MARRRISVAADAAGTRLDRFLAEAFPEHTRSYLQRLVEHGQVTVDGLPAKASVKVQPGQDIVVDVPPTPPSTLVPEEAPLEVVFEDRDLVVIDKPAGLVVHPAAGHDTGTLANIIIGRWEGPSGEETLRPGIVHRLDKDTSGLMVVAKNPSAQANLAEQIKQRLVTKRYLLLVKGHLTPERGVIEAPIGRDPRERKRMAVVAGGREARTRFQVREHIDGFSLVEATLETGRTHQIRVHFRSIGFPLVGDPVYGVTDDRVPVHRQFLHACLLGFRLPSTGEYVEFKSDLPDDLREALRALRERVE
ncbi:MAG: RluA family pseudouridine synthase [Dehalococcoidales bacterium]|nr:RluA family pseudouridine synthase [Dehalococcoidales bacterium]